MRFVCLLFGVVQAAVLSVNKAAYNGGEAIEVTFSGGAGGSTDWIGLFKEGDTPAARTGSGWVYLDGTQIALRPLTAGKVQFNLGVSGGSNWIAYFFENNGYTSIAQTSPFAVDCVAGCSECGGMSLEMKAAGCITCDNGADFYDNNGATTGGTCTPSASGCADGFYDSVDDASVIDSDTSCLPCTTGCARCTASGLSLSGGCVSCADGYFPDADTCTACTPGCALCDGLGLDTTASCRGCADGYYDDGSVCQTCTARCARCDGPGVELESPGCLACDNAGNGYDNNGIGPGGTCVARGSGCRADAYDSTPANNIQSDTDCVPTPFSCHDGVVNNAETGVDCGGEECPMCPVGQPCMYMKDCETGACEDNICVAGPTCIDGVANRDESDVDCGGLWCRPCQHGRTCTDDFDCQSSNCTDDLTCGRDASLVANPEVYCVRWNVPSACKFLTVRPLSTSEDPIGFYQYGKPYGSSANAGIEISSVTQTFLLKDNVENLPISEITLTTIHDKAQDGSGGKIILDVQLSDELLGYPSGIIVEDDVNEVSDAENWNAVTNKLNNLDWAWNKCCTDGMSFGPVPDNLEYPSYLYEYIYDTLIHGHAPHDEPLLRGGMKPAFRSLDDEGEPVVQYIPWRQNVGVADFTVEPGACPERPSCAATHATNCPSCELDPLCSWCGSTKSCVDKVCGDCPDPDAVCPIVPYCEALGDCKSCAAERDCGWCNVTMLDEGNSTFGNMTNWTNWTNYTLINTTDGNTTVQLSFCIALYKEEHYNPCADFKATISQCPKDPEPPIPEPNITITNITFPNVTNITNITNITIFVPPPDPIIVEEEQDESKNDGLLAGLLSAICCLLMCVVAAVGYKASKLQEEIAEMVAFAGDDGVADNALYQGNTREAENPLYK